MRALIDFFRTPAGKLTVFIALFVLIVLFLWERPTGSQNVETPTFEGKAAPVTSFESGMPRMAPVRREPQPNKKPAPVQATSTPLPIDLYMSTETQLGGVYAPYGRLIPCELVITVDSARL